MHYRKDLDSLRAISILAVLIYHFFPNLLPSGYLGVDVFFVISGYLITSIILDEQSNNQFSFLRFYARRIRRIYPSLLFMLATSLLVGYLFLFPHEYKNLALHTVTGNLFSANFLLLSELGYFDISAISKPLLHLWSLAIEEQFYLLWPLALIWGIKHDRLNQTILSITIVSLAISLIGIGKSSTFYIPLTRFWELSLGGYLAYRATKSQTINPRTLSALWSYCALGILMILFLNQDKTFNHPGFITLVGVLAASYLVATPSNIKLLNNKPLQYIGLISYPLYLFHWPILSFSYLIFSGKNDTFFEKCLLILISIGFSVFSYEIIERKIKQQPLNQIALKLLITSGLIALASLAILLTNGASHRVTNYLEKISAATIDREYPEKNKKYLGQKVRALGSGDEKIIFIGDSNIEQYYPRVKQLYQDNRINLESIFITRGGCSPIPNIISKNITCDNFPNKELSFLNDPNVKKVVIGALWSWYFNNNNYMQDNSVEILISESSRGETLALHSLEQLITSLREKNIEVFVIGEIPSHNLLDPKSLLPNGFMRLSSDHDNSKNPSKEVIMRKIDPVNTKIQNIAERQGAKFISMTNILCNTEECPSVINEEPLYRDFNHLNATYVREHALFIDAIFK
jgi:peptidoglycan/LPS O-acetylase OafA/YrhL